MNVESSDTVWIVNNRKKLERCSPIDCRTSARQRFFLTQWRIQQQNSEKRQEFDNLGNDTKEIQKIFITIYLPVKVPRRLLNFSTGRCGA